MTAVLSRAQQLGFLGPGAVDAQVDHALAFAVVDPPYLALDLGSGGGLPGLVLAKHWPSSRWVLLEAQTKRSAFLLDAIGTLGLTDRVEVLVARAEEAAHDPALRGAFDLVTARSFGPPAVTAECAVGFLRVGGHLVVSEPPEDDPRRWPSEGVAAVGLRDLGRIGLVRCLECDEPADAGVPRAVGKPSRRPRW